MGDTKWKRQHMEQGLCTDCSAEEIPTTSRCAEHEYRHNVNNKKVRENNLDRERERRRKDIKLYVLTNRCRACGNALDEDADEGYVSCMNCRSRVFREAKQCR